MRDYTKIEAWKLADDLTVAVYEGTRAFPREEIYGLTSQLRRAAYSVPANIAEGSSRAFAALKTLNYRSTEIPKHRSTAPLPHRPAPGHPPATVRHHAPPLAWISVD